MCFSTLSVSNLSLEQQLLHWCWIEACESCPMLGIGHPSQQEILVLTMQLTKWENPKQKHMYRSPRCIKWEDIKWIRNITNKDSKPTWMTCSGGWKVKDQGACRLICSVKVTFWFTDISLVTSFSFYGLQTGWWSWSEGKAQLFFSEFEEIIYQVLCYLL